MSASASHLSKTLSQVLHALRDGTQDASKSRALPKYGLRGSKAFALIETTKGALGVGFERGDGVLIKVLGFAEDGTPKLSAPLPVKTHKVGFGISLGFNQVYTALLLNSEEEIKAVVKGDHIIGTDVDLPGNQFSDNREVLPGHFSTTQASHGKSISVSDSLMLLDFSLNGGKLSVDPEALKGLYGATSVDDVLSGSVPAPAEFAVAYKYLADNFLQERPAAAAAE